MLSTVGDWLVIDSRWAEGFDARKGASVAARLLDYEAAGPADDWWITTWPEARRDMVSRRLRGPVMKQVDQATGETWILGNETTRVSGTVSLHRNRSSLVFEMKRREDGTFDQQLALALISECLAGGCDSAYSVAGLVQDTAPLTYIGLNDLSAADGTLYGYGWVNAFNPHIAEQLRPAALGSGLDWSESEHGALLTLSRVDPDHQELQRLLDVVRPLLRPLEEEVDFNAPEKFHTFATEHIQLALSNLQNGDGHNATMARKESGDILDHYQQTLHIDPN